MRVSVSLRKLLTYFILLFVPFQIGESFAKENGYQSLRDGLDQLESNQIEAAEKNLFLGLSQAESDKNEEYAMQAEYMLGRLREKQAKYSEAETYFKKSLAYYEKKVNGHAPASVILNSIGELYYEQKRLDEAFDTFEKALSLVEKYAPVPDDKVARGWMILRQRLIRFDYGDYKRGLKAAKEAYKYGNESSDALVSFDATNHLAISHFLLGSYDEAERLYKIALKKAISLDLKVRQDRVGIVSSNLANLYLYTNRLNEARTLYQFGLEDTAKEFGRESSEYAWELDRYGNLLLEQNELIGAAEAIEKASAIRSSQTKPILLDKAMSFNSLAKLRLKQRRLEEALLLAEKSLELRKTICSKDSPVLAIGFNTVAEIYKAKGNKEKSKEAATRAFEINSDRLGVSHPLTKLSLSMCR